MKPMVIMHLCMVIAAISMLLVEARSSFFVSGDTKEKTVWMEPGQMKIISADTSFQTPNATNSHMILNYGLSVQMSLYCNYFLPCEEEAGLEFTTDDYTIKKYCGSTWTATPLLIKKKMLSFTVRSGLKGTGRYNCLVINEKVCSSTSSTTTAPTTSTVTTTKPPTTTTQSTTTTTTIPITVPITNSSCQCGTTERMKVVGGEDVEEGEIPWQVGLGYDVYIFYLALCGGTLVSEKYVITAAHCIVGTVKYIEVLLGTTSSTAKPRLVIKAYQYTPHESYDKPYRNDNDIGILLLSQPVTYSKTVFPACLPKGFPTKYFDGRTVTVSGWGNMKEGDEDSPVYLKKASLKVLTTEECQSRYYAKITPGMLCAYADGKDTCQGDSGGPLTYTDRGVTFLAGATSFGKGCGRPDVPGVYARITHYMDWIEKQTGNSICYKTS